MKSIIMIAYAFPPEGNAGSYRPLRFVRHLPSRGWQPTVITLQSRSYERYDPSLLAQVPSDVTVLRVPNVDPWNRFQEGRRLRIQNKMIEWSAEKAGRIQQAQQAPLRSFAREVIRTLEAWCYHPDLAMGWIRPAVKATVEFCARNKLDILWATGGPWSSFIVAQRASRLSGVPYVLDFRDAWTLVREPFATKRPASAILADRRILYGLLKGAQAVVFRYKTEAECYWRAYPGALDTGRIHIIPNGFDGAVEEYREIPGDKCKILYSGTLAYYRYDTLLDALAQLKQTNRALAQQLDLLFIGEDLEHLSCEAASRGLSDMVHTSGPVSYGEITKLQQQSHALLMLEREPTIKGYELLAGAKLFGYLKPGRPIIGVLPEGEARNILRSVGVSTIANIDSTNEIVDVFKRVLRAWSEKTLSSLVPNPAACGAFSAENQTATLVRALEGRSAVDRFVPGVMEIPPSLRDEIGSGNWVATTDRISPRA